MKKVLVIALLLVGLFVAPGLHNVNAANPSGDGLPEEVLPPWIQN